MKNYKKKFSLFFYCLSSAKFSLKEIKLPYLFFQFSYDSAVAIITP